MMLKKLHEFHKKPINGLKIFYFAAFSAICFSLCAPPANLFILEFFMFIPGLFIFSPKQSHLKPKHAFLYGYLFGIMLLIGHCNFLVPTLRDFGGIPLYQALMIFCLYLLVFSIKYGFLFYIPFVLHRKFKLHVLPLLLITCFLLESLFPDIFDLYLGNGQFAHSYFIQIADIIGAKGISLLIIIVNFLFYKYILTTHKKKLLTLLILFFGVYSYAFLKDISLLALKKQNKIPKTLNIGVIQPNLGFTMDPVQENKDAQTLITMSNQLINNNSLDLLVWPESAVPYLKRSTSPNALKLFKYIDNSNVPILYNAETTSYTDGIKKNYSTAILHQPHEEDQYYSKIKLLAFGEYLPLEKYLHFLRASIPSIGMFSKGDKITNFHLKNKDIIITPLICYEVIKPSFVRQFTKNNSDIIINITNDKWFGKTKASTLHLILGSFRAIENHIPLVRGTNSGISTALGVKGNELIKQTGLLTKDSFVVKVPIYKNNNTFYKSFGDWPIYLVIVLSIMMMILQRNKKKSES